MTPTLHDGDMVVIDRQGFKHRPPQVGAIVAARPLALGGKTIVKRVHAASAGHITLRGDNASDSLDSRRLGPVALEEVIGSVRLRLWPHFQ